METELRRELLMLSIKLEEIKKNKDIEGAAEIFERFDVLVRELEEDDDFPYDFLRMLCDILDLLEEAVSEDGESDVFEQNISTAIDIIEDITI
ncbi:MAG: hypothetical protein DBX36_01560 [Oscillospiraceae bacterium]|jgi:hypothetical protein|nr:MAG: hypothetical protein DBX36_01560 [Oscillospiraceae bacterium]